MCAVCCVLCMCCVRRPHRPPCELPGVPASSPTDRRVCAVFMPSTPSSGHRHGGDRQTGWPQRAQQPPGTGRRRRRQEAGEGRVRQLRDRFRLTLAHSPGSTPPHPRRRTGSCDCDGVCVCVCVGGGPPCPPIIYRMLIDARDLTLCPCPVRAVAAAAAIAAAVHPDRFSYSIKLGKQPAYARYSWLGLDF